MFMSAMFRLLLWNAVLTAFGQPGYRSHRNCFPALIAGLVAEQRLYLNPCHTGLRVVGDVASAALADRRFRRRRGVRQRMVAEGEEAPSVGLGESLAILHRHVDAIELAVEEPASGWFLTRTV